MSSLFVSITNAFHSYVYWKYFGFAEVSLMWY